MTGRNGGVLGTGFFFGSVVQCGSDDTSFYCRLSKLVSTIGMIIFLLFIMFIIVFFLKSMFGGKGRRINSRR
jgi:hypothetical protein